MGLEHLATFTIKINCSSIGKYTHTQPTSKPPKTEVEGIFANTPQKKTYPNLKLKKTPSVSQEVTIP